MLNISPYTPLDYQPKPMSFGSRKPPKKPSLSNLLKDKLSIGSSSKAPTSKTEISSPMMSAPINRPVVAESSNQQPTSSARINKPLPVAPRLEESLPGGGKLIISGDGKSSTAYVPIQQNRQMRPKSPSITSATTPPSAAVVSDKSLSVPLRSPSPTQEQVFFGPGNLSIDTTRRHSSESTRSK